MAIEDGDDSKPPEASQGDAGAAAAPFPWKAFSLAGKALGLATGILVAVVVADQLVSIYVDYLWFQSVGFDGVFLKRLNTQIPLFVAGYLVAGAAIGGNIWLARRSAPRGSEKSFISELRPAAIWRMADALLVVATLLGALMFGAAAAGAWETVLRWLHAVPFGQADPQFGRDIGFFLFDLPVYRFFQGWLVGLALVSALGAAAVYGLSYPLQEFHLRVTPGMRIHLSMLGGAVLLLVAVGTYLSVFELVTSARGLVAGAMYTDVNARLPLRYIVALLAAVAGLATMANAFVSSRSVRLPLATFGLWVAATIGAGLYASAVQSFQVEPNELRREEPYIGRNIDATRRAWGLDRIVEASHPARPVVTPEEIAANPETLENIRILDPDPLTATLNELQALRPFYRFADIDISRYPLNGARPAGRADQQVLISARELDLDRVADRNWTRDHLQLTHGFGAIVTPVTEVETGGLPRLALRDIPPRTPYERLALSDDGARIYFGELTRHYVIVNTRESEFDYPDPQVEGRDIRTSYEHDRGIVLSSRFRRLVLAWELGDLNLLISGQIHNDSRLLMHRQIGDRVRKIAPFLMLDSDPYPVIVDGALKWMLPAYTVAGTYPYSQPAGGINYIRGSVQIVVDASSGDMDFYRVDVQDPVALTFSRIFPRLFTPGVAMPDALRQQARYPLDLFRLQAQHYQGYHVTDAKVFFLGEDFWQIPIQRTRERTRAMEPYYVTMQLPGESRVEFVLIAPFTPRGRENTIAWLAGRSDGAHFGSLRNFRFPSGVLVFGPSQIDNRIDQNALISQQLTLWDTAGSAVLRSALMMVPVGDSFLYVQPVYLQAADGRMPELRRVIVANGSAVAMEETFARALEVVTGQRAPADPGAPGGAPEIPAAPAVSASEVQRLVQQARESSEATQAELNRLRELLDRIKAQLGPKGP